MDPDNQSTETELLDEKHLGVAGNMAKSFIHSPLSPLLLVAALAIGVLGLLITPRQEDPQISVPMVDIFVRYPGASVEQVATLVTDPLQRLMKELTGVKHVYSASMRDQAMVIVRFKVGENLEDSLVKLYDKLESNKDRIPPGVSTPLVKPKSVDDVPVVTLTLWSDEVDDATLDLVAQNVMQRLNELPNTSQSFIVHGRTEQVRVEPLPEKLESFGVTLGQLAQTISSANSEQGVGRFEAGGESSRLYSGAFLETKEDIERLVVGIRNGRPVYVRDVAQVVVGPSEANSMVAYYTGAAYPYKHVGNGAAAVTIAVAKKKGSNGVTVANDVLEMVGHLKGRIIPDNVVTSVTRNYGKTARDKVNELIFKLFIATGAVAILILFTLGLRAAVVVVIVIPVVILTTVFSAWVLKFTIDRVSLFALIFSIGILVDDAIVVVENIYRRWLEKGESDTATAVDAVREVGNPTILATFTVIAALLPMGFVTGMMGPYMMPIPVLGSVAMVFSLFAAFIFTPWLTMRLKPPLKSLRKAEEKEHREKERLGRLYHNLLVPLHQRPVLGYGFLISLVVVFFACCFMFYSKDVRVKMLPLDNKPEFNVVVNMPTGTALPVTANVIHQLAEELRRIPEVTAVQSYAGTSSPFNFNGLVRHYYLRDKPWQGDIQVQLVDKHERERTSHELAQHAREVLKPISQAAGARSVQVVEMPPGPPVMQTLVTEVYGPTAEVRRQVTRDIAQMFDKAENIDDVDTYLEDDYEVWQFEVDREKALRLGISVDDVNKTLEMAMGDYVLGDVKTQSVLEPIYIVLQLPLAIRSNLGRLTQLPVMTPAGTVVPLSELGDFRARIQDKPIYMTDLRRMEYATGEGVGYYAAPIYGMLEVGKMQDEYTPPDGGRVESSWIGPPHNSRHSSFEWTGEWTVTYETFRDMGIAFGVALVLIYMLVVWEFGNFILPAIVMAPIPLTLIGIVPGHWLFDAEFTATSMIGFIALAGIIVRNSILLVDFTKHEVARGVAITEAVINACKARTRPIVITALALVLGSSVILTDPIFQGMAVSLLFGVLVSTLLTLLVIPLGCISAADAFLGEDVDEGAPEPVPEVGGGAALAMEGGGGGSQAPVSGEKGFLARSLGFLWTVLSTLALYVWLILQLIAKGLLGLARVFRKRRPPEQAAGQAEVSSPRPAATEVSTPEQAHASDPVVAPEVTPQPAVGEGGVTAKKRATPKRRSTSRKASPGTASAKKAASGKRTDGTKSTASASGVGVNRARGSSWPDRGKASPGATQGPGMQAEGGADGGGVAASSPGQTPSGAGSPRSKVPKSRARRGIRLKGDFKR